MSDTTMRQVIATLLAMMVSGVSAAWIAHYVVTPEPVAQPPASLIV
jgi:hypothetical protein